ncbi:MAG: hypothetical protein JNN09_08995 [Alphaproteobacteria bacterium]|nr:hypothetical protein [Alphaproteobacteria bacterium]
MSLVDWILRPVFSRDLRKIQTGQCRGWDLVSVLEKYNDRASQERTNSSALIRNEVARAALESLEGRKISDDGYYRCLDLIAEAGPSRKQVLNIVVKQTKEDGYLNSACYLGSLVERGDFEDGVFAGAQSDLLLRCAQLIFTFRHKDNLSVENVLSSLTCELDRRNGVDKDLSDAIRNTIVPSRRLEQLDPVVVFRTLCVLKTPSAAEDAARLFFRHPDLLSVSLCAQITQRLETGDEFGRSLLREVSNPDTLMREIRAGGESLLRRAFQDLVSQKGSGFPAGNLRNQFERCAEAVKEAGQEIPLSAPAGP